MTSTALYEITNVRLFKVSPTLIYRAWSEPEHLARWWGPKGFSNTFHEFDFQPGGFWRFTMHGPDGTDYLNECRYVSMNAGGIVLDHTVQPLFRVVATFEDRGHETQVTFRMIFKDEATWLAVKPVATVANEENFDRLEAEIDVMLRQAGGKQ